MAKTKALPAPKPAGYRAPPALYREPFRLLSPADLRGEQWRALVGQAPIVRSCVQTLIMQLSAIEWYIEGDDQEAVDYFTKVLETADDGSGFEVHASRVVEDSLILPFGGAAEIGHFSDGVVAWVQHIDAATMVPTYDEMRPYAQIDPWSVGRPPVSFREEQVGRVRWQAETRSRSYGWTKTPASDALPAIQALLRSDRFWQLFLSDSPPAGILDVMDMTEEEARDWWESWQQMMAGPDPFKVALLYGGAAERKVAASFIQFMKTPAELSMMEIIKLYAQEVAACFGMTLGDLGLFDQEMRLAGAAKMIELSKRQGLARIMRGVRTYIDNDVLPDGISFRWMAMDLEDEVRKASAANQRATSLKTLTDAGIATQREARTAALTFGLIPEDAFDDSFASQTPEPSITDAELGSESEPTAAGVADDLEGRSYVPPRAFPLNSPVARRMLDVVDRLLRPALRGFTKRRALDLLDLGIRAFGEGSGAGIEARSRTDAEAALLEALNRADWWRSPDLLSDIANILRLAYEEGLGGAADDIERERIDLGLTGVDLSRTVFNVTNQTVLDLLGDRAGAFITRIDESTRSFIVDAILRGVREGISSPEIAREILVDEVRRDLVQKWRGRALSITNTEINWAESRAALGQQSAVGLTKKRWISVPGLACRICAGNDDRGAIPSEEMFESVFGPVEGPPGHPTVCHCYLSFDRGELRALGDQPRYWTGGKR